jgi:hypothetical protein
LTYIEVVARLLWELPMMNCRKSLLAAVTVRAWCADPNACIPVIASRVGLSEAEFHQLFEHLEDVGRASVLADAVRKLRAANSTSARMLGFPLDGPANLIEHIFIKDLDNY